MKRTRPGTFPVGQGKSAFKKPRLVRQNATVVAPVNNKFTALKKQGPELKNLDQNVNGLAVTFSNPTFTTPGITEINVASQGTTAETRIGRKIVCKSLLFRWSWSLGATSTGGSPLRILVIYDKQTNAAVPAITQVLALNDYLSPMNLANSERFVILKNLVTEPVSLQNNFSISGSFFIPMALETVFNDTNAGTIGDIQTGAIFFMVAQDSELGTGNGVFSYNSRIRFEDA